MNINTFTEKAQEALLTAQTLATDLTHSEVTPEHLLVALVEQKGGAVASVLTKAGQQPAKVASDARALLKAMPQAFGADVRPSAAHEPDRRVGPGRGAAHAGRVRQHRAPAARHRHRGGTLPRCAMPAEGGASRRTRCAPRSRRCAATSALRREPRVPPTRPLARYGRDLTELAQKASSIRSSAGTRKCAA